MHARYMYAYLQAHCFRHNPGRPILVAVTLWFARRVYPTTQGTLRAYLA